MIKKLISFFTSLCIFAAAVSGLALTAFAAESGNGWTDTEFGLLDENGVYHIQDAQDLKNIAKASETATHYVNNYNQTFVLDNDIDLVTNDDKQVNIAPYSTESVFHGTFDGNGHTISGLHYSTHQIATGLFGRTEGATIKNLTIDRAEINATYAGGIVAGISKNTKFMNISIKNSHLKCIPGNVSLSLFTDGGMTVGALAAQVGDGSLIYNCESINTSLETGEAQVGDALGGSGFYLGGLVGSINNSHIEYSRTITLDSTNNGKVSHETVGILGVLSFFKIYIGGICGEMRDGATVIDSFSNISMYNHPATAVGVVTAMYAYIGGIAGAVYGKTSEIDRCHYSGYADAWDYAAVLVGGPDKNKHLGGVAGRISDDGGNTVDSVPTNLDDRFTNSFYNYDRIMENKDVDALVRPDKSAVAWRDSTAQSYNELSPKTCGSYTDVQYSDQKNSWETYGYDFDGSILRDTPCNTLFADNGNNGKHVNQWVMHQYNYTNTSETKYTTTTMPIHGITTMKIYSNEYNAFTDENPKSIEYTYTIDSNGKVTLPQETDFEEIDPNLPNDGFIGIAFVSERDSQSGKTYSCDALYTPGYAVDSDVFEAYGTDPSKKIYAVWCQAATLGAQLGLNNSNRGVRVLTAVNTDLLENIGLTEPDIDYNRGATFRVGSNEYFIQADSEQWIGESYREAFNAADLSGKVSNAKVFSIFADPNESYDQAIEYEGDILYKGTGESGDEGLFDFLCGSNSITVSGLAERYLNDLKASGASEEDNYGLAGEQYNTLMEYINQ